VEKEPETTKHKGPRDEKKLTTEPKQLGMRITTVYGTSRILQPNF